MTPTVTRAPKGTYCYGCNAPATVRLDGEYTTHLCPACLALLAAGPQRKVFEAKNADGDTVLFRSDGKGWVEYRYLGCIPGEGCHRAPVCPFPVLLCLREDGA